MSADIGIHHLHLTDMDIGWFDSAARFAPAALQATAGSPCGCRQRPPRRDLFRPHPRIDDDGKQLPFGEAEAGATGSNCCCR